MHPVEAKVWEALGAVLNDIGRPSGRSESRMERMRLFLGRVPNRGRMGGAIRPGGANFLEGDSAASPKEEAKAEGKGPKPNEQPAVDQPVKENGTGFELPARAVSLFSVDATKISAGVFFGNLTFQRNDPNRESSPVFQRAAERPVAESCRQFFAYSIPWGERGGSPVGPLDERLPSGPVGYGSLGNLVEAATAQALHLAARTKREEVLVASYTSAPREESGEATADFFGALPWAGRRRLPSPQVKVIPQI